MKCRKFSIAIVLCMLVALLALPAGAAQADYVFDEMDLLTPEDFFRIEDLAANISQQYECGVYIATMWDYKTYGNTVIEAAENYYTSNGLGLGSDNSGVLLLLSMTARDYALVAHGKTGNRAFTDYGKDQLSEAFLDNFYYDDWSGGLTNYVLTSGTFLESEDSGKPVDVESNIGIGQTLLMILVIPAAIAGISCGIMAASMKTARSQTHANDYRKEVNITGRHDQYLTRTVTRQKIESSSSSRGGTTVKSNGFSGKSGKF